MDLDTPYRGGFVGREHHFALTVYFEDTDTAGIVYYANYLKYHGARPLRHAARRRDRPARRARTPAKASMRSPKSPSATCSPARLGRRPGRRQHVGKVRAASGHHSSASHARGRHIDRCAGHRGLPRRRRPAEAPAEEWVERFQAINEEGLMPNFEATGDLMSPLTLFLHADIGREDRDARPARWPACGPGRSSSPMRSASAASTAPPESLKPTFWASDDIDAFHAKRGNEKLPSAAILSAGLDEWRRSTAGQDDRPLGHPRAARHPDERRRRHRARPAVRPPQHPRHRRLGRAVRRPVRHGLGDHARFTAIADANNTSLAVVAPGIAEALFATAIGLFAAIPAVIAYNRLTHGLDRLEARLGRFADRFHATLSRELEVEA